MQKNNIYFLCDVRMFLINDCDSYGPMKSYEIEIGINVQKPAGNQVNSLRKVSPECRTCGRQPRKQININYTECCEMSMVHQCVSP